MMKGEGGGDVENWILKGLVGFGDGVTYRHF